MAFSIAHSASALNYIRWLAKPITAYPFTVSVLFNPTSTADATDGGGIIGLFNSASTAQRMLIASGEGGSGAPRAINEAGVARIATAGSTMTAGAYCNIIAVFADGATTIYVDDDAGVTVTASTGPIPAGLDRVTIGRWDDFTPNGSVNGAIAEVGIWAGDVLTAQDRTDLAAGYIPASIQFASLVFYAAGTTNTDLTDPATGVTASVGGTVSTGTHPTVQGVSGFAIVSNTLTAADGDTFTITGNGLDSYDVVRIKDSGGTYTATQTIATQSSSEITFTLASGSVPYSDANFTIQVEIEDTVGEVTHVAEFTHEPPSGYSLQTLSGTQVTDDTSLGYYLGVTFAAGDQVAYQTATDGDENTDTWAPFVGPDGVTSVSGGVGRDSFGVIYWQPAGRASATLNLYDVLGGGTRLLRGLIQRGALVA